MALTPEQRARIAAEQRATNAWAIKQGAKENPQPARALPKTNGKMSPADAAQHAIRTVLAYGAVSDLAFEVVQQNLDILRNEARHTPQQEGGGEFSTPRLALDWAALAGLEPPPRQWIIPHWLPDGHLTLLSGRGGIGKSLLAQHIATAVAGGKPYMEPIAAPKRVLMWACEDDEHELWRRQLLISSHLQVPLLGLSGAFVLHGYAGADVTLMAPIFGKLEPTPMLAELAAQVALYRAEFVILDNIARLFGGNENDRHAVTTFCALVQGACAPAAVLLLGHPAKGQGSEFSGSTAWEGAVRSRLYFSDRPPDEKPDDEDAPPVNERIRYLSRRKANYSDLDLRQLTLIDGVLIPLELQRKSYQAAFDPESEFVQALVIRAVEKLSQRQIYASASPSTTYLPKLAKQYDLLDRLTDRQFAAAMRCLIMAGKLVRERVGEYDSRNQKFGLVIKV